MALFASMYMCHRAIYGLYGLYTCTLNTKSLYTVKHLLGAISAVKHHGLLTFGRQRDVFTHVMLRAINVDDDDAVNTCHGRVTTYTIL